MYRSYQDRVAFLLVYIREAHAGDAWALEVNAKQGFEVPLARTYEEKDGYADLCVRKLDIEFPTLVDRLDFPVEAHYASWPERLYLVDTDGKILYKGPPGPFGFKPAELENAIRERFGEPIVPLPQPSWSQKLISSLRELVI